MPLALLARHDHPVLAEGLPGAEALDRFPILGGRIPVTSHRRIAAGGYRPLLACDDYDVIGRVALNSDALVVATPALTRMGWPYSELAPLRSEEHTSELQSLIRISYAIFFLYKKPHP